MMKVKKNNKKISGKLLMLLGAGLATALLSGCAEKNTEADDVVEDVVDVVEDNVKEDVEKEIYGDEFALSDLLKSDERILIFADSPDENCSVDKIVLTRPDGTFRYVSCSPLINITLGELSKMDDDQITEFMDSHFAEGAGFEDSEKEALEYIQRYVSGNNLQYWLSIYPDASGDDVESEAISCPELVKGDAYPTDKPDDTRFSAFVQCHDIEGFDESEINDSRYVVMHVRRETDPEAARQGEDSLKESDSYILTRYKDWEDFDVIFDSSDSEGLLINEYIPADFQSMVYDY